MRTLFILALLLTNVAMADTFNYGLYGDELKSEKLDILVELHLSGKFEKGSRVLSLKVWGEDHGKKVLLFNVSQEKIKYSWSEKANLTIDVLSTVNPLIHEEYFPMQTDTGINPGEEYSIERFSLNQEESLNEDGFFIANQTQEEMATNGFLKRLK